MKRETKRSRTSTESLGEFLPTSHPGEVDGKMQNDSANRFFNPDGNLEQSLTERRDLRSCELGASRTAPSFLHEDVGCSRHQNTELIGKEAGTAGPIDLQTMMQFLDPVFCVVLRQNPDRAEMIDVSRPNA